MAAPLPMITIGFARPTAKRLASRGISCFPWQATKSRDVASNDFKTSFVVLIQYVSGPLLDWSNRQSRSEGAIDLVQDALQLVDLSRQVGDAHQLL